MKRNTLWWTMQLIVLVTLAAGGGLLAQEPRPDSDRLTGVINDYSPKGVNPTGPWEIRGVWTLRFRASGKADFTASLTMELSDPAITATGEPGPRMQHTHHIVVEDAQVERLTSGGFELSGPVTITKDGSPVLASSTLTVTVTGGTSIALSNVALTFSGPASMHFGSDEIHGVIRRGR
jgi:hypothetical protein